MFVLGNRPGAPGHGIPGSLVGYMPQVFLNYIPCGITKHQLKNIFNNTIIFMYQKIPIRFNFHFTVIGVMEGSGSMALSNVNVRNKIFCVI